MTINTGLPASNLVPGTSHKFNTIRTGGSLVNVPEQIGIIGCKSSAGTGTLGVVYDADDPAIVDGIAGIGSEAALMVRQAILCANQFEGGPRIKYVLIAEPGAGTAAIKTITFTGTAAADGNIIIKIAGRTYSVGVRSGESQNTITSNAAAAINLRPEILPTVVTSATNVVTSTHRTKGVNGNDIAISVPELVAGITAVVATTTPGAGAADIQPGLDALAPLRYSGIPIANHTTTDITAINADITARWAVTSKNWGYYYLFEAGTIGTATALATAANNKAALVGSFEGCLNAPGEGAVTMAVLVSSRELPNAGFDGVKVPLFPPNASMLYTPDEQNTAIKAGLTPFVGVIDSNNGVVSDQAKCVMMVTTKTTAGSAPDDSNRDIAMSRTGIFLAINLDIQTERTLGPEGNRNGVSQEQARPLVRLLMADVLRAAARNTPPIIKRSKVESDVAASFVEEDAVLGRNNAKIVYHPDGPNHQTAYSHDILVGP